MDIAALTSGKRELFEDYLRTYLAGVNSTPGIFEASAYSLQTGGKRLRPVLTMLACESLGGRATDTLPAGLAIEMIHTFSLIHDDLPALDNDELRRGRPTCHARFGEAAAILAGDALIFQAVSVIAGAGYPPDTRLEILGFMAEACGAKGLVQGEYQDLSAEGAPLSLGDIQDIYYRKTAKLFELCMFAGARIAGGSPGQVDALVGFGTHLGLAFQAIDDILDLTSSEGLLGKTTGKDLLQDKATVVKALGLEEARAWARDMTAKAVELLPAVRTDGMEALKELAFSMLQRVA
ncbi:MAG: polyprenyl synthetase family protein [Desulfomonilia bacterium]